MSGPVKLNARDLRLLAFLGEKKGAPLDVLGHRFFATDPRTGAENKHPVRACARRISTLTAAGYLAQSDLDEGLVDGQRSTMVSLAAKGAKRIGARVRRIHARHFDHHVVTIRVCEAERRRLLAAGAAEADYRLEHEFMADAYAGEHRTKGTTFDAFPDAVLTVDDGTGPYRVAVEYVTRAYTDGQIAEKSATFSGFRDVLWVADGAGTAGRVEHITHQECITA